MGAVYLPGVTSPPSNNLRVYTLAHSMGITSAALLAHLRSLLGSAAPRSASSSLEPAFAAAVIDSFTS